MPYAQIEHFSEPGTTTAGMSVVETAVEPSSKTVNTAEGLESAGGLHQVTVCSESATHESSDSLRDFIANMFRSLQESQTNLNDNQAKFGEKIEKYNKELSEKI
jgi:hypothetical protein